MRARPVGGNPPWEHSSSFDAEEADPDMYAARHGSAGPRVSGGGSGRGTKAAPPAWRRLSRGQACIVLLAVLCIIVTWASVVHLHRATTGREKEPTTNLPRRGALQTNGDGIESLWTVPLRETKNAWGDQHRTSIRYSHSLVEWNNHLVTTLGYFYDRENRKPAWLGDTWGLDLARPEAGWVLLHAGKEDGLAPEPRFGHSALVHDSAILVFGGSDGGRRISGEKFFEMGLEYNDVWSFDLTTLEWKLIPTIDPIHARYLHGAALSDGVMYVYGGLGGDGDMGSVFALDLKTNGWIKYAPLKTIMQGGPGARMGHEMAAVKAADGSSAVFMYGGRVVNAYTGTVTEEFKSHDRLDPRVWVLDQKNREWKLVQATVPRSAMAEVSYEMPPELLVDDGAAPDARMYFSMKAQNLEGADGVVRPALVIFGGSLSTPRMSCAGDAWALILSDDMLSGTWQRLADLPVGHYHMKAAAAADGVYTTGGHLCSTTVDNRPFYYLNTLMKIQLHDTKAPKRCAPSQRKEGFCPESESQTQRDAAADGAKPAWFGVLDKRGVGWFA